MVASAFSTFRDNDNTDLFRRTVKNEIIKKAAALFFMYSQWLINLVENLLSVNRVTNGEMKLNCSDEVLDDIIDEAMHHIDRHAENHIIEVKKSEDYIT